MSGQVYARIPACRVMGILIGNTARGSGVSGERHDKTRHVPAATQSPQAEEIPEMEIPAHDAPGENRAQLEGKTRTARSLCCLREYSPVCSDVFGGGKMTKHRKNFSYRILCPSPVYSLNTGEQFLDCTNCRACHACIPGRPDPFQSLHSCMEAG